MCFHIAKDGSTNKINHHEKLLNTLEVPYMNKTFPTKVAYFSCVENYLQFLWKMF